jgi:ribosomal peptide maturation radical SAM protein 1
MSYLRTLLPHLVAQARRYQLFYETKSNLRKDQVELLAAAGVTELQPGIESFSTSILKLMAKGTTRLQNVQLLKWCSELGVKVTWNLLYGFPGEEPGEYGDMAALLPALYHLPPPTGAAKVRLDRFGPYWKSPERYGIHNIRPWWTYDFVFAGLPESERGRFAYFFEYEYGDERDPQAYIRPVVQTVGEWRGATRSKVRLELQTRAEGPVVIDTRPCRTDEVHALTPAGLALMRALDGFRGGDGLPEAIREQGVEIGDAECAALLDDFLARRFVIQESGCFLSLIVDPQERQRVAERQVALRLDRFGFRWPDDFPDPAKREVVRTAMLALGAGQAAAAD